MGPTNILQHVRQEDLSVDRELREIVELLNRVAEKLGVAGSSFPSDVDKQAVQAVNVARNLYSVAVQMKDGFAYCIPGLFQKVRKIPEIGTDGQVLVANEDGNATWDNVSTIGAVITVTGTAPVASSGGASPVISMAAATGSVNGYLTSTDWTTFNNKQAALGFTPVPVRTQRVAIAASGATVTFSSALSGTIRVSVLSCKDADGIEVECNISSETTTNFYAYCPVAATLTYYASSEV